MSCKDCKHCEKKGLLVQVLRYCAVVADDAAALADVPALPGKLGKGVTDLGLAHAKYGTRFLREGYLYVLTDRAGIKSWEGHMVLSSGQLYGFPVDTPPVIKPEPLCNRDQTSMHAYMVGIRNAHEVKDAWFLFTPSALTPAKLDDYKKNAAAYAAKGKMQHFGPAAWLAKTTNQPHTLLADELHKNVIEYVLYHQQTGAHATPLGKAMVQQLFPARDMAYTGEPANDKGEYPGTLGNIHTTLKRNGGAVLVVNDHIGITQELNDFRNAPLDELRPWLQKTHSKTGVTHERMLHVSGAIADVRNSLEQGKIARQTPFYTHQKKISEERYEARRRFAARLRAQGRIEDAQKVDDDVTQAQQAIKANYAREMQRIKAEAPDIWKKYNKKLAGVDTFDNDFAQRSEKHNLILQTRVDDHLKWLTSARLVDALDVYDKTHAANGQQFQDEIGLAMHGMNYTQQGWQTVLAWMQALSIKPDNLLLRGFCCNQDDVEKATGQALAQAKSSSEGPDPWKALDSLQAVFKDATGSFKKTAKALEKSDDAFKSSYPGMGMAIYSTIGQGIFKVGLDKFKGLDRIYAALLASTLGRINTLIRLSELAHANTEVGDKPSKKASQGQNVRRVREAIDAEILKGSQGDLYKLRVASVITLIEAYGLFLKSQKLGEADDKVRARMEITAAALALSAAGFEGFAIGAEFVQKRYRSVTAASRGAAITLGGIKLFAGTLASFAAGIGSVYDFMDMHKAGKNKQFSLAAALFVRATAQASLTVFTLLVGFSYSAATWEFLAKKLPGNLAKGALHLAAGARFLAVASRLAFMLRVVANVTWVGIGLTILIWVFSDNELEDWCEKSSFRKDPKRDDDIFPSEAKELEKLYTAFNEVK